MNIIPLEVTLPSVEYTFFPNAFFLLFPLSYWHLWQIQILIHCYVTATTTVKIAWRERLFYFL